MSIRLWLCAALVAFGLAALPVLPAGRAIAQSPTGVTVAQVYNGPGLNAGAGSVNVSGLDGGNLRVTIAKIVNKVLSYVALIAVVMIIIAGLYLILSLGSDSAKETAKKIVIYTIIGLLVILIAKALVMFVIEIIS